MTAIHAAEMVELGIKLWGAQNMSRSSRKEARFGAQGSKSIDLEKGVWFDHEIGSGPGSGGGYRDLYRLVHGQFPENGVKTSSGGGKLGLPVAWYDYKDAGGTLLFQVVRFDPKDFRQRRPSGSGGWIWNLKGVDRVLYRLPELLKAPPTTPVYVCEGEKDVDTLRAHMLVATCNPGGAAKGRANGSPVCRKTCAAGMSSSCRTMTTMGASMPCMCGPA
jgi:hypothetical protein